MKNTYKLARKWHFLLIGSCVGFLLIILMAIFFLGASIKGDGFFWTVLIFAGMVGGAYGTLSSKITTSVEGIEYASFGIRAKATWDKIERVDINSYGFVNLLFKEPLYKSQFVNALFRPLAYDRTIQLSPYIEDLATSYLLKDIAKYAPNSNIPEFIAENNRSTKTHQKAGTIGLYFLGWLIALIVIAIVLRKGAEHLEMSGYPNVTLVSFIIISSLIIGFLYDGLGLLGYNAEIAGLSDNEISHKARTHYLSPLVTMLMGFLAGVGIWAFLRSFSIILSENDQVIFALVALIIGTKSLRVSSKIERLLFQDKTL